MSNNERLGFYAIMSKNCTNAGDMSREQAMIYLINFFNSRVSAANRYTVTKVKELMVMHNLSVAELVDKYVDLVYKNS